MADVLIKEQHRKNMQTMLRMVGFGDNAGSGFPDILKIWSDNGWETPELMEDAVLNLMTLILKCKTDEDKGIISADTEMSVDASNKEQNERRSSEVLTASDYKKVEKKFCFLKKTNIYHPKLQKI